MPPFTKNIIWPNGTAGPKKLTLTKTSTRPTWLEVDVVPYQELKQSREALTSLYKLMFDYYPDPYIVIDESGPNSESHYHPDLLLKDNTVFTTLVTQENIDYIGQGDFVLYRNLSKEAICFCEVEQVFYNKKAKEGYYLCRLRIVEGTLAHF